MPHDRTHSQPADSGPASADAVQVSAIKRLSSGQVRATVTIPAGAYVARFWDVAAQAEAEKPITIPAGGAVYRVYAWDLDSDQPGMGLLPMVGGRVAMPRDEDGAKFLDRDEYPADIETAVIAALR